MSAMKPILITAAVTLGLLIVAAMFVPQVRNVLTTGKFNPPPVE